MSILQSPYKLSFPIYLSIRKKATIHHPSFIAVGGENFTFAIEINKDWHKHFSVSKEETFQYLFYKKNHHGKTRLVEYLKFEKESSVILTTEFTEEKEANDFIDTMSKKLGIYSYHVLPGAYGETTKTEASEKIIETLIDENPTITYLMFYRVIEIPEENKRIKLHVLDKGFYYFTICSTEERLILKEEDLKDIEKEMKKQMPFHSEVVKILEKNRVKLIFG